MEIKLDEKHVFCADNFSFWVERRTPGAKTVCVTGYHARIENLLSAYFSKRVAGSGAKTMKDLARSADAAREEIRMFAKALSESGERPWDKKPKKTKAPDKGKGAGQRIAKAEPKAKVPKTETKRARPGAKTKAKATMPEAGAKTETKVGAKSKTKAREGKKKEEDCNGTVREKDVRKDKKPAAGERASKGAEDA